MLVLRIVQAVLIFNVVAGVFFVGYYMGTVRARVKIVSVINERSEG